MKTFLVWCPEESATEDDAREFRAFDHDDAAKQWAERDDSDSADYRIVGGRWEPEVLVKEVGSPLTKRFKLTGEAVPSYRAVEQ